MVDVLQDSEPTLLWVNHFAGSPTRGRGLRHFEIGRELISLGWNVTVAAAQKVDNRSHHFTLGLVEEESIDEVEFRWLGILFDQRLSQWKRPFNWLTFTHGFRQWARRSGAADLVIGSSPHLFAAWAAERHARRLGVPFVLEVRDLWPESLVAGGGSKGPAYHALNRLALYLYAKAVRIIVLAEGTAEYLVRRGIPKHKILFVPNGVDVERFPEINRPRRESFTVTYAGAHGPANGLETVLEAAAILRDHPAICFHLIGSGPIKMKLIEDAQRRGLTNVRFDDPVPAYQVPEVLGESDAGLMVLRDSPLFSFGVSPNKLFDYLAAGLPVVCNVPGEVADLLGKSGGGIQAVDASPEALVSGVLELYGRRHEERLAMGREARAWVSRERNRRVLAERLGAGLADALREALQGKGKTNA